MIREMIFYVGKEALLIDDVEKLSVLRGKEVSSCADRWLFCTIEVGGFVAFIITGDTHGTLDIGKVVQFFNDHEDEYGEDDYLIICGDVGVCGFNPDTEKEVRRIFRELPVTVLFIDGNHEHHQRLNDYPVDEWMDGKVHIIESNIIHLPRWASVKCRMTRSNCGDISSRLPMKRIMKAGSSDISMRMRSSMTYSAQCTMRSLL